ncbi:acyl-CoA dehydrogenase family protein [Kitasatospora sp. NPDC058170]|uniref:acyl-CoA dehydrogenase family protein n=1 Tax=Kitasatospora sp. NPDC058170 TaxID=3346364 RepID=UPI0036DF6067
MRAESAEACALVTRLVGDQADDWDRAGRIPTEVVKELAVAGLLGAQIPPEYGGQGFSSAVNGEFTAHVGTHCSSLRSLLTSHGMAAWTVQRMGSAEQRAAWLPRLAGGSLCAVAFSEPGAGSDLSAMTTTIRPDGDAVVVDGGKTWITAAAYADLVLVFGRHGSGAAAVLVPADAPGVRIRPVPEPMGCRAAGHSEVALDGVRVDAANLLGGAGLPVDFLVTPALSFGRLSVAWGCVGILRACLTAATRHARGREQFGRPLAEHQLVARHLAELVVAEQAATRYCEHASRLWDEGSPELVNAAVLAKHLAAGSAAAGASAAVQVLGSAGARDGSAVARAYRDAKLMQIIEGSDEICQLLLAKHAEAVWS